MIHLLALLAVANANAASVLPTSLGSVEAIEGSGPVTLTRAGRAALLRNSQKGTALFEGDLLQTGEKVAVRVGYKDGSKQLLAANTRIRLHFKGGIPSPEFLEGAVDSQVKPQAKPSSKTRFLFRTKTATLGVRGTEFVVHTGPRGLEVHTLKGVVEAVRDERDFGTAKAIAINEAFEVVGIAGTQIPAPSAFVPKEFLDKVAGKYPELGKLLTGN